jgi:hypothetical protein
MPNLPFNGTVPYTVYNRQTVTVRPRDNPAIFDVAFNTIPIVWAGAIPLELRGKSISTLPTNIGYDISYTTTIRITGTQQQNAITYVTIVTADGNSYPRTENSNYNLTGPINTYDITDTFFVTTYPIQIKVAVTGSTSQPANNFTLIVTLNISLIIPCTGNNLNNPICSDYCAMESNRTTCFNDMLNYCLPPGVPPAQMPIGTDVICQTYIKSYIDTLGPNTRVGISFFK